MPTEPRLTPELITADLTTRLLPSAVLCYEQLGSTMDAVRERARAGASEGLLVLAEEQTAGRGRMGRSWFAPPGSALLCSLLLRPSWLHPTDAFGLTMLAALSLCAAVEEITPLRPVLKWPNDMLLPLGEDTRDETHETRHTRRELIADHRPPTTDHRKAAGILIELEVRQGKIVWAIVGCGVNVHSSPPSGPDQPYPATSLDAAAGQRVDRLELLRALLRYLDSNYEALQAGGREVLFDAWQQRLITLGKQVRVAMPNGTIEGLAEGVARSGALLIRDTSGMLHTVTTGDVAA